MRLLKKTGIILALLSITVAHAQVKDFSRTVLISGAENESMNIDISQEELLMQYDKQIAQDQQKKVLGIVGMIAGSGVYIYGAVDAYDRAQEEADRLSMQSGQVEYVTKVNTIGLFVGLPIIAISSYLYIDNNSKISKLKWKKRKLQASLTTNSLQLALSF